jgi:hypothetical protein
MNINSYAETNNIKTISLNLGCGGRPLKGWINVDNYDYEANDSSRSGSHYDIKMDIRDLDVEDNTCSNILLVHVLEHFVRWEALQMLTMYFQKLHPTGKLIIEMPDLDKCIEWYLAGEKAPHMNTPIGPMNMGLTQFYGNQWDKLDYETHRYVWRIQELCHELNKIGFKIVEATHDAKFHQKGRDMFVVAEK